MDYCKAHYVPSSSPVIFMIIIILYVNSIFKIEGLYVVVL